jgi:hypothetical protein
LPVAGQRSASLLATIISVIALATSIVALTYAMVR